METMLEPQMGRFAVEVELVNDGDLVRATAGVISPDQVRRTGMRGVVDSGATRLVIPEATAKQLGLEAAGTLKVRYADGRSAERAVAERVRLTYGGRSSVFSAVIEPARESALIGAIVLEELDFLVDCTNGRLVPRDPKQIISEIE
jgi:predicted aspartyl protease